MMKLKILNLDGFLETIGRCRGPVYQVVPDGHDFFRIVAYYAGDC